MKVPHSIKYCTLWRAIKHIVSINTYSTVHHKNFSYIPTNRPTCKTLDSFIQAAIATLNANVFSREFVTYEWIGILCIHTVKQKIIQYESKYRLKYLCNLRVKTSCNDLHVWLGCYLFRCFVRGAQEFFLILVTTLFGDFGFIDRFRFRHHFP